MRRSPHRLRQLAAVVAACAVLGPVPAAPAAAAPAGDWWYSALKIEQNHAVATGDGVTIALIDSQLHPAAPELRGQDVQPVRSYCAGVDNVTASDGADHATAMAALMVGSGRDGGIRGVAPDATVRVYTAVNGADTEKATCATTEDGLDETRRADGEVVALAIRDALRDGVDIINLSLRTQGLDLERAIYEALEQGVPVIAAVNRIRDGDVYLPGDSADVGLPAAYAGVVAVTAADKNGDVWSKANGNGVFVAAPGVDVRSGAVDTRGRWSSDVVESGTSQATAIVSGMLAVVKSEYPRATGAQLVQHLLRNTTSPLADYEPLGGYGLASLTRMLATDPTRQPTHFPFRDLPPTADATANARLLDAPSGPPRLPLAPDSPGPTAVPSAAASPAAGAQPARELPSASSALPLVLLGGVGAAALAGGLLLLLRRRRPALPPLLTEGS